jgi:acetolactate synthase I/III small subunit
MALTGGRSAKPSRIDAFMKLLYPFGILESSRSGMMALPRTPLETLRADSDTDKEAEDIVDVTSLPPG